MNIIKPEKIKNGDTICIIAPSGNVDKSKILNSAKYFENLGYRVKFGKNVLNTDRYLAGKDEERIFDLEEAFNDKEVKAIICARGGYGTLRIIKKINYEINIYFI